MGRRIAEYPGLKGGGLSVKIAGVERVNEVHNLVTETTSNGDGAASFWMEPPDPFLPKQRWPEVRVGADVDVTYTLGGVTRQLYKGYIVNDPRRGYAGETKRLEIECGGVLEVARWRGDVGFLFTDADLDQWFENKRNAKWVNIDISDQLELRADDDTKVQRWYNGNPRAAIIGYLPYEGATYLHKNQGGPLDGIKMMKYTARWNLKDEMYARLAYASGYKLSRNPGDYSTIRTWGAGDKVNTTGTSYTDTFGGNNGAGYVVLMLWTTNPKGVTVKDDRFIRLDDVRLYTDTSAKRIDQAMLAIANYLGFHTMAQTEPIDNVLESLVARPPTNPVSALNMLAQQGNVLVEWGWFSYYSSGSKWSFRARPLETRADVIRSLSNCYSIDATEPGTTWDVRQHPEDGSDWQGLRFRFGRLGKSDYPAGFPDAVAAPGGCNTWTKSKPFLGASARILTADFTSHNYSREKARKLARRLWRSLGSSQSSGRVTLRGESVHTRANQDYWVPTPYIRGGDWVECEQSSCGPLLVTRSTIDYDSETVSLEVGIEEEALLEQLEAAGAVGRASPSRLGRPRGTPVTRQPRRPLRR